MTEYASETPIFDIGQPESASTVLDVAPNSSKYFRCEDGNLLSPVDTVTMLTRLELDVDPHQIQQMVEPSLLGIANATHVAILQHHNERIRRALDASTWFTEYSQIQA